MRIPLQTDFRLLRLRSHAKEYVAGRYKNKGAIW